MRTREIMPLLLDAEARIPTSQTPAKQPDAILKHGMSGDVLTRHYGDDDWA